MECAEAFVLIQNFSLYLHQHIGISDDNDYLKLFEELLDLYGVDGQPAIPVDMVQQARNVSTNIKSWLRKDEQVMVFILNMFLNYLFMMNIILLLLKIF